MKLVGDASQQIWYCRKVGEDIRFGLAKCRGYRVGVAVGGPENGVYTYTAKAERTGLTLMVR